MPRIGTLLERTAVFIYPNLGAAKRLENAGGTGFFLGIPIDPELINMHVYIVSVRHVIEQCNSPVIRVNTKSGTDDLIETNLDEWYVHPEGVDLAIAAINVNPAEVEFGHFLRDHFVDDDFIKEHEVGMGDEIAMIGRFKHHEGRQRIIPVARFGYLATSRTQPMPNPHTRLDEESFLVEMRSISGYSGSPVVLLIEPFSRRSESGGISAGWHLRLLGIDWGHIETREKVLDQSGYEHPDKLQVKLNSAMSAVIPAWKLDDLLDIQELVEMRNEREWTITKDATENPGSLDS